MVLVRTRMALGIRTSLGPTTLTLQSRCLASPWSESQVWFFGQPSWKTNSVREGPRLVPSVSPARRVSTGNREGALELLSRNLHILLCMASSPVLS